MHKEELTDGQSLRGFALATIAFLAIFAATAIPIPLYADYQATIGLTTADISNTMFTYLTGVALTLLLAGRISDAFGRTPVTSLTLMLAIVGCIMFMMADSGAAVLAARFVQGLSAGFGMSAVSALVIDCVGEKHLGWGSTVASCGAMVGIMIGSVAVGILYDIVPSIAVLYGIMIVILAACLFLMPVVHEPLDQTLSLRAVLRVRVYIPTDNRRLFAVVAVCYLATWLVSCFYQSFSAPIAQQCFGETSPLAGSVILALIMAPSLLGGPLRAQAHPRHLHGGRDGYHGADGAVRPHGRRASVHGRLRPVQLRHGRGGVRVAAPSASARERAARLGHPRLGEPRGLRRLGGNRRGLRHPSGGDLLRLRVRRHGRRARRCQPVRGGLPAGAQREEEGRPPHAVPFPEDEGHGGVLGARARDGGGRSRGCLRRCPRAHIT